MNDATRRFGWCRSRGSYLLMNEAGVRAKLDGNDLVNVDLVSSRRTPADFVVEDCDPLTETPPSDRRSGTPAAR